LPDHTLTAIFNGFRPQRYQLNKAVEPAPKCRLPLRFQTKLCPVAVGMRGLLSTTDHPDIWMGGVWRLTGRIQ